MSSTTLMDRARALLSDRAVLAATAAAITPLATAAARADISTWHFGTATLQSFQSNGYGGNWQDYMSPTPTVSAVGLPDGLKVYGYGFDEGQDGGVRAFRLAGSEYINGGVDGSGSSLRLHITGDATLNNFQWDHTAYALPTTFNFGLDFNGGTLSMTEVSTGFTAYTSEGFAAGVGSGGVTAPDLVPGGYGFGFQYVDNFGNDPLLVSIAWEVNIAFNWSGQSDGDVLQVYIPFNSIDLGIAAVPTPGAAGLAVAGGLVAMRRRRR